MLPLTLWTGGGRGSVAGPPLIGCISIMISLRPPLPIWLCLPAVDWLRRHSSAIYKSPPGCFFFSFWSHFATSVFFFSFLCLGFTICLCVCVTCLDSAPRVCQHKGAERSGRFDRNQERESYSYNIFEGERKAVSFRSKQD